MKDRETVVTEFNELVNMTASELEDWLACDDSASAGWPKGDGESVGHDSGRKIVEILKGNPDRAADQYSDGDVEHMRRVAAYCKRHLAQEQGANSEKSEEELKKTKSYVSLKNWGHDFLKGQGKGGEAGKQAKGPSENGAEPEAKLEDEPQPEAETNDPKSEAEPSNDQPEAEVEAEPEDDPQQEAEPDDAQPEAEPDDAESDDHRSELEANDPESDPQPDDQPGHKRKTRSSQGGSQKRHETQRSSSDEQKAQSSAAPQKGDTVSWKWGGSHPEGTVLDVKEKATTTTKNGNKVSRNGTEDDPAVVLDAGGSKAVKLAHELD